MSKEKVIAPIKFTYDGVDYVLEYSRMALKQMRDNGFDSNLLGDDADPSVKLEMLNLLWEGAFFKHHKNTKLSVMNEIYEKMPNKGDLIGRLVELYAEPFKSLTAEPSEGEAIRWE